MRHNGRQWATSVTVFLRTELKDLWASRNEAAHSATVQAERIEAITKLKSLYEKENLVGTSNRQIFGLPLRERMTHATKYILDFVKQAMPAVKRVMKDYKQRSRTGSNNI
jgi:hypothetical protein